MQLEQRVYEVFCQIFCHLFQFLKHRQPETQFLKIRFITTHQIHYTTFQNLENVKIIVFFHRQCHKVERSGYKHFSSSYRDSVSASSTKDCSDQCRRYSYCRSFSYRYYSGKSAVCLHFCLHFLFTFLFTFFVHIFCLHFVCLHFLFTFCLFTFCLFTNFRLGIVSESSHPLQLLNISGEV